MASVPQNDSQCYDTDDNNQTNNDTDNPVTYSGLFERYCRNCRAYTQVYNIFENGVIQFTACNTCSHIT